MFIISIISVLTARAPGTPAYKSPEEYYDEIIDLKKVKKPYW